MMTLFGCIGYDILDYMFVILLAIRVKEDKEDLVLGCTKKKWRIEKMSKKLCKLVKDEYLVAHLSEYIEIVKEPKYICKKCGRVSDKEKRLCKSKKMKD